MSKGVISMCGRFSLAADEFSVRVYLSSKYGIKSDTLKLDLPRYNIAPGQMVASLIDDGKNYRQGYLKWGFVPVYENQSEKPKRIINLRSETVWDKPYLEQAIFKHRCVVIADGFYEWQHNSSNKNPYRIQVANQQLFSMAALWSSYINPKGAMEHNVAILTTQANEVVQKIHDRMPVILEEREAKKWLNPLNQSQAELSALLRPYPDIYTTMYKVGDHVNNYQNDNPECILEIN